MENASKALIIAGAILLAILLISLGILIFNQAQDTVNNSGMSQAEITAFNNRFLKYEGIQKGSVIKSLINEVISSNGDSNNSSAGATIDISLDNKDNTHDKEMKYTSLASYSTEYVDTKSSYNVSLDYTNGRVSKITIKQQ